MHVPAEPPIIDPFCSRVPVHLAQIAHMEAPTMPGTVLWSWPCTFTVYGMHRGCHGDGAVQKQPAILL